MGAINLPTVNVCYTWDVVSVGQDCIQETGGRLNKKDSLTRYGDSHVKDKTS